MQVRVCAHVDPSAAEQSSLIYREPIKIRGSVISHIDGEIIQIIAYFCNNEKFLSRVILTVTEN